MERIAQHAATPSANPALPPCAGLCEALEAKREGVSRRAFVSAASLAAAVAILEACGASGATSPGGSGGPITVSLASYSALSAVGGVARVDGGSGSPTALVRTGASSFVALSMVCPHAGTTVNYTGSGWTCPNHGAQFATTGAWSGGQGASSLTSFTTVYDGAAGTVKISRPS
jgi:nitrite reductase/ring-hydroxylating ferredoxin subunit